MTESIGVATMEVLPPDARPTYRMVFFETPRGNYIGKFVSPSPVDTAVATRTKVTALYQWGVDLVRDYTGLDKDAFDLIMIER